MSDAPVGHRIRQRRQAMGLTQSALAQRLGISASYLNLIEHDRRSARGGLIRRLADALSIDPVALSGAEESRVQAALVEASGDPVLADTGFDAGEADRLVTAAPTSARALLALYRQYCALGQQVADLAERVDQNPVIADLSHQILTTITSIRSSAEILSDYDDLDAHAQRRFLDAITSESTHLTRAAQEMFDVLRERNAEVPVADPETEVEDFITDHTNHFPSLETAAEDLVDRLPRRNFALAALDEHLAGKHGITIAFAGPEAVPASGQIFNVNTRTLTLAETLPMASVRFRMTELLAGLESRQAVEATLANTTFSSQIARERARRALMRYVAAATLMPYDRIHAAAETTGYDVARMQQSFGASFEQVCQRLTSLQRPGQQGIPFHFVRSDIAGNLAKRFSASGLRLPRFSGACPRWILHESFRTPGRLYTQVAEMPDGDRYFFLAQARTQATGGYATPPHHSAVMLGCDLTYARRTVYAARLGETPVTPVGTTCRQCPRGDCAQRVAPLAVAGDRSGPAPNDNAASPR